MPRVAYLGPAGTNSEEALFGAGIDDLEPVACTTIEEIFESTERGLTDLGFAPIENSVEGSINATLDALAFESSLEIQGEYVADIHHALVTAPGVDLAKVERVVSIPAATGQCRRWLARHLPGRPVIAANSTAESIQRAVADPTLAGIGTSLAAQLHGGHVHFPAIEDYADTQTRFVLLGRGVQPRTGDDKTSLALFLRQDKPGALLMVLSEFAYGEVNLTKIQSRPTKRGLGDYMFFIDLEGHVEDANVKTALDCLRLKLREVKVLGSYPRARR